MTRISSYVTGALFIVPLALFLGAVSIAAPVHGYSQGYYQSSYYGQGYYQSSYYSQSTYYSEASYYSQSTYYTPTAYEWQGVDWITEGASIDAAKVADNFDWLLSLHSCTANAIGEVRYSGGLIEWCDGVSWQDANYSVSE